MMQNRLIWRDKGDEIYIKFDKRKGKKLTAFKMLAISGPRIICWVFHLLYNWWKSHVAMASSCAEHPAAGDWFPAWHQTHLPLTQKSLAWSASRVLPFDPCDLITALIDSQSSHLQSTQSFSKRLFWFLFSNLKVLIKSPWAHKDDFSFSCWWAFTDDLIRKCLILGSTSTGRNGTLLTLFLAFSRFSYWTEIFNLVCFFGGFVMK